MQVIPAVRLGLLQATLVAVETIHQRIKRLREGKGLSQEALGKAAGVTYQSVQDWEHSTAPARKRLAAVAKALGVSEQYLLSGQSDAAVREAATVSARALDVARRFDQLNPACQDHVSSQIDLLSGANSRKDRARAAQHDAEIKNGALQSSSSGKIRRRN